MPGATLADVTEGVTRLRVADVSEETRPAVLPIHSGHVWEVVFPLSDALRSADAIVLRVCSSELARGPGWVVLDHLNQSVSLAARAAAAAIPHAAVCIWSLWN